MSSSYFIEGTEGDDMIHGGTYSDTIKGAGGDDEIYGGEGDDNIEGGDGDDTIYGEAGDDIINGGIGNDLLWGGDGSDTFQLNDGIGTDIVKDFVIGEDSLEVMSGSLGISMTQAGNHTMIYQEDDLLAFLGNVIADDLTINGNLIA